MVMLIQIIVKCQYNLINGFHTSKRTVIYPKLNSTLYKIIIFKFLGLMVNQKKNKHIDLMSIKCVNIFIIFSLKSILPSDVLHTLYNSLIMPHFYYCLLT